MVPAGPLARIAWTARPWPSTAWCRTCFSSRIGEAQSGRGAKVHRLPAADLHVESLVATLHERGELVDGEVVFHAVAELSGDIASVVPERPGRLLRLPAAVPVLERLRQVPVVERGERLDASREQFINEAAVEVYPLRIRCAGTLREDAGPGDREPVRGGADSTSSALRLPCSGGSGRWRHRRCRCS